MDIKEVDTNFKFTSEINIDGIKFYDPLDGVVKVYGAKHDGMRYARIDMEFARSLGEGYSLLGGHTAGVRVRFITDSPFVSVSARVYSISKMEHFAFTGSAGFDVYGVEDGVDKYQGSCVTGFRKQEDDVTESVVYFETGRKERLITVNFPSYTAVSQMLIGVSGDSYVKEPTEYKYSTPVVYYGSSITQGACSSRPGITYQSIISRMIDCDFINLGFSGGCVGQPEMVDYIAGLDMSAFVLDYDHNAPSVEHLEKTHYNVYKGVREKHPKIPIIMMTRPKFSLNEDELRRLDVVKSTYARAVAEGDLNVYIIEGRDLIRPEWAEIATVDGCHPTDAGFACMAEKLGVVLKTALENIR